MNYIDRDAVLGEVVCDCYFAASESVFWGKQYLEPLHACLKLSVCVQFFSAHFLDAIFALF